jgi:ABC-type uncharacterized transport system permease subunit
MDPLFLALPAAVLYVVATVVLARSPRRHGAALVVATVAVLLHGAFHAAEVHAAGGPDLHFFAALSLASLATAAVALVVSWTRPIAVIGLVTWPLAVLFLLLDATRDAPNPTLAAQSWQITLHAVFALLAWATLSLAAVVAVMLFVQERALRSHRMTRGVLALPPLTLVEGLLFQLVGWGFALLSATLLSGVLFVQDLFSQHLVHKTALSIAAWVVFGVLMFGRWRWGWRGRRAVRWTLVGVALLLLAFVGSKFVLEIVLGRAA